MKYVCKTGFEHHVVMNASKTAGILKEAYENYMGWEVYHHEAESEINLTYEIELSKNTYRI